MKKLLGAMMCFVLTGTALAQENPLQQKLAQIGLTQVKLSPTPIKGLQVASTERGIFYVSEDGEYLIDGKMYQLTSQGAVNLTNQVLMQKLNAFAKEMIVFPAKNEKYVVNVFLDTSCYYCHLMFAQTEKYNELGITVRYLAFPARSGIHSESAQQMEAIWTAENPNYALQQAENEKIYPSQLKQPKVVKAQYLLGEQFGVRGTPAIVTASGELLNGYIKPDALLHMLEMEQREKNSH